MSLPKSDLFEDELPDVKEELKLILGDPEPWLDTPNEYFGGRKPREVLGTGEEIHLRNLIRRIKHGMPT
jgi:hypothetical protein